MTATHRARVRFLYVAGPMPTRCRMPLDRRGQIQRGYGWIGGRPAHVWAFERAGGRLLPGFLVCHLCSSPPCCRLEHLTACSMNDNIAQAMAEGRTPRGVTHHLAKLTDQKARDICTLHDAGVGVTTLARHFGIAKTSVQQVLKGVTWTHATGRTVVRRPE